MTQVPELWLWQPLGYVGEEPQGQQLGVVLDCPAGTMSLGGRQQAAQVRASSRVAPSYCALVWLETWPGAGLGEMEVRGTPTGPSMGTAHVCVHLIVQALSVCACVARD